MQLDCNDKANKSNLETKLPTPNKNSLNAFREVEKISSGKKKAKKYSSASELKKDLDL